LPFRPWKAGQGDEILSPWLDPVDLKEARQAGLID
jgi:hypothetical protein